MSTPDHFRFTLTKRQVNDLEDNLLLDGDEYVNRGVEQPDGTFQFDLGYEELLAKSFAIFTCIDFRCTNVRNTFFCNTHFKTWANRN